MILVVVRLLALVVFAGRHICRELLPYVLLSVYGNVTFYVVAYLC